VSSVCDKNRAKAVRSLSERRGILRTSPVENPARFGAQKGRAEAPKGGYGGCANLRASSRRRPYADAE
jgi:hypothetical protein